MPEFFLELFSEEIPAGMQKDAANELLRICRTSLGILSFTEPRLFFGPKRIAISAKVDQETEARTLEVRGPRRNAPENAIAGFLGKYKGIKQRDLFPEGEYFWLRQAIPAEKATRIIEAVLREVLRTFSWPKSMRWGQGGDFAWVRPLRRVVCLLDREIIPIKLGPITASNETEGHRTLAPGAFPVSSCADWQEKLRDHYVIADQEERRDKILRGITEQAAIHGLTVVKDEALLDEVTGLVEWPVPLIGKIDNHFMDLPPEVRELSMKVNQRYFALRDAAGNPAPYFAFVANLEAPDNGAAIIAGNERVLRARLSDARHFWDQDLKTPLDELLPKLDHITFHAKIGTQGERVKRIAQLADEIALALGADEETALQAGQAGLLSKVDLVTGMVGEFPELQGVIGGYYAERKPNGWDGKVVGPAIKTHYQPKGPSDDVPTGIVAVSVALADKLDTLREFFRINEKPTGSGDPYALRRAALGVIRIILENNLRLSLRELVGNAPDLFNFIIDRLRVKLRGEGSRFDVLDAVLASGTDDDLLRIMKKAESLSAFLATSAGVDMLSAYRRASNILGIEEARDGIKYAPQVGSIDSDEPATRALSSDCSSVKYAMASEDGPLKQERFEDAMRILGALRVPVDQFFERVTVNDPNPELRRNRLALLAQLRDTMHQIADFSKIEG
jgi:glycyl-tRNA synthetase beta chain